MKNKIALESLALDLKRGSVFLNRNSQFAANQFLKEAVERKSEIDLKGLSSYIQKIILDLDKIIEEKNKSAKAENLLMYSTIIQNYALTL
ncbi:MAG TPA: hypothetical protein VLE44_00725 [Candidatus Saccharimonadales bacterium]|nr:hypothetical protein [Candidatus Saccharimonadales bacterium]